MSFLYPMGLLALIGVPVLIIIYIIKNKYTEITVTSTYIWTLSERFLKHRLPISKITGIISLILQLLAVIVISLVIAHPIVTVPAGARDYCFVLDGSGSMNAVVGGETRFGRAKDEICDIIDGSMTGSTYTLVYSGYGTEIVFERATDKDRAKQLLGEVEVSYVTGSLTDAQNVAQTYFDEHNSAEVYLVTDKKVGETGNIHLVDVSGSPVNYAIESVTHSLRGGKLVVEGTMMSYSGSGTAEIELYFNDETEPAAFGEAEFAESESSPFSVTADRTDFESLTVSISNADDLAEDSRYVLFNLRNENMSAALLVGDSTFFMRAALTAAGVTSLTTISAEDYLATQPTGYGLYVFDGVTPDRVPSDGAVWLVKPDKGVEGSNFAWQGDEKPSGRATFSTSTATNVRKLLSGTSCTPFELSGYVKCGLGGKFDELIEVDGKPLLFVGATAYGNREVVFAFPLNASAGFTLSDDCSTIISNLLDYSFPQVVDRTEYVCGEILQVNMVAGTRSLRVVSPRGKTTYPDTTGPISECTLTEAGVYDVILVMNDGTERVINVFAALPESERAPSPVEESFLISGEKGSDFGDGIFDNPMILIIILAVLAAADYGVYCYEQYQLR